MGLADLGEVRPLGKEAVAGVDGLGAVVGGDFDDLLELQVGLAGRRRADVESLVGVAGVDGVAVSVGVDGDGADGQLAAGPEDAHRDLAAVGDQDLLEELVHGKRSMTALSSASPCSGTAAA